MIAPQGAIYLSVRVAMPGQTNEADPQACCSTRPASRWCPSRRSACEEDSGWFRISVGAVSLDEIDAALPRVRAALAVR